MEALEFTTPSGEHKVVLKSFITGHDKRKIESVFLSAANFKVSGNDTQTDGLSGDLISKSEDATIEAVVISVDGVSENIVNAVLGMRVPDYEFVMRQIKQITDPLPAEKKSS